MFSATAVAKLVHHAAAAMATVSTAATAHCMQSAPCVAYVAVIKCQCLPHYCTQVQCDWEQKQEESPTPGPTGMLGLTPFMQLPYFRLHSSSYDSMHTIGNNIKDIVKCLLNAAAALTLCSLRRRSMAVPQPASAHTTST